MAECTWTEQHDWGPGKYLTMVPPERVRVVQHRGYQRFPAAAGGGLRVLERPGWRE
jgi:hypothetical protein